MNRRHWNEKVAKTGSCFVAGGGKLSQAIYPRLNKGRESEVEFMRDAIIVAIVAFLILRVVTKRVREWLFGRPGIDEGKGFPYSRKRRL
jgi:hypothetical protein